MFALQLSQILVIPFVVHCLIVNKYWEFRRMLQKLNADDDCLISNKHKQS